MKQQNTYEPMLPTNDNVSTPIIPIAIEEQPLGIRLDTPCAFCEHADNCNKSMCFRRHHVENGLFTPYGQWFQAFVPEKVSKPTEYLFCDRYIGNMSNYDSFFGYLCSTECLEYITPEQRNALLELICKKDFNLSDDEFEYKFARWIYAPPVPEPEKISFREKVKRMFIIKNKEV